jgi:hypothetical protein
MWIKPSKRIDVYSGGDAGGLARQALEPQLFPKVSDISVHKLSISLLE